MAIVTNHKVIYQINRVLFPLILLTFLLQHLKINDIEKARNLTKAAPLIV